ncbi:hypothetical protein SYNTR_0246 [Candidatus Syntrophocurvum alkaliphilum]|uniref:Copper amine oxidase-like N-terminal domain-containing protein n=1 Tax=Candidatus Syntrophocurvum alkaliphilum TaxID=2293317 RepID=A0A6I6DGS4_9FIRM|nr:stalk domain-containing protein [Candidatus Syntrophocurvum alkaliphilum]QGT98839.1 hypothetical protein SYNTR_0246 [Candidatus Syntrophocurvum alkaliphilum]
MSRFKYFKVIALVTFFAFMFPLLMFSKNVDANLPVKVFVDGVELETDVPPTIINDRTMVPLRAISEGLGMKVDWLEEDRYVIIETKKEETPKEILTSEEIFEQTIFGESFATSKQITKVALKEGVVRIYPNISDNELDYYVTRAQINVTADKNELTTEEVKLLNKIITKNSSEFKNLTSAKKDEYLSSIATTYYKLAQLYLDVGEDYGIRGDIAFFQAAHETGWWRFGGDAIVDQNNYCGLGTTGSVKTEEDIDIRGADPNRVWYKPDTKHGAFFDKPVTGVEAQMQHLFAYASTKSLPSDKELVSPRFRLVNRGSAPNWIDLGGKWAFPGYSRTSYSSLEEAMSANDTYGHTILKHYMKIPDLTKAVKELTLEQRIEQLEKENQELKLENERLRGLLYK